MLWWDRESLIRPSLIGTTPSYEHVCTWEANVFAAEANTFHFDVASGWYCMSTSYSCSHKSSWLDYLLSLYHVYNLFSKLQLMYPLFFYSNVCNNTGEHVIVGYGCLDMRPLAAIVCTAFLWFIDLVEMELRCIKSHHSVHSIYIVRALVLQSLNPTTVTASAVLFGVL